jgi:hypothetical protein
MVDENSEAIVVMQRRLAKYGPRIESGSSGLFSAGGNR